MERGLQRGPVIFPGMPEKPLILTLAEAFVRARLEADAGGHRHRARVRLWGS